MASDTEGVHLLYLLFVPSKLSNEAYCGKHVSFQILEQKYNILMAFW